MRGRIRAYLKDGKRRFQKQSWDHCSFPFQDLKERWYMSFKRIDEELLDTPAAVKVL